MITVLTTRLDSERLPRKALIDIDGRPLISWVAQRLRDLPGQLVLAAPDEPESVKVFSEIADDLEIGAFFGNRDDVVKRVTGAMRMLSPDAQFVFRALGDCPFLDVDLVKRSIEIMTHTSSDAFLWHLEPHSWPVYGSREFPYSIRAWRKIWARAKDDEREHVDLFFHRNREQFKIAYHEPPPSIYFRPYRLEVDYKEDVQLIRAISRKIGMLAPTQQVIKFLDKNPDIAAINRERVEKTGPLSSYDYSKRREWARLMVGQSIYTWLGEVLEPPDPRASHIFCVSGTCFVGFGWQGILHTPDRDQIKSGFVSCECGSGRYWSSPK